MQVYKRIRKAWTRAVPIISLTTVDIAAAIDGIAAEIADGVILSFDVAGQIKVPTQKRLDTAGQVAKQFGEVYTVPQLAMQACKLVQDGKLQDAVIVVHNAHRFLAEAIEVQAICNCRDIFKSGRVMLVLAGPTMQLPIELQSDVIEFDEQLPGVELLNDRIRETVSAFNEINVDDSVIAEAANASIGLSLFAAEQIAALNVSKDGLSPKGIWDDKCRKISETPGLKVVNATSGFDDIAGLDSIKNFLKMILNGDDAPNAIVWVDEIEKSLGGIAGDNTGVSQDQLGVLLQHMQDSNADGCILLGVAGAAKSEVAKKAGFEAGIPTIQLDLGGMKGKLVGDSEGRIRAALKVIDRVSGGKTLWLATSNNISILPPELLRRFKLGVWFFDLPNEQERRAIWEMYVAKNGLTETVSDELLANAWTGAEIRTCCEISRKAGIELKSAAVYISPVSVTGRDQLEALRERAEDRYLSATTRGVFRKDREQVKTVKRRATAAAEA